MPTLAAGGCWVLALVAGINWEVLAPVIGGGWGSGIGGWEVVMPAWQPADDVLMTAAIAQQSMISSGLRCCAVGTDVSSGGAVLPVCIHALDCVWRYTIHKRPAATSRSLCNHPSNGQDGRMHLGSA